MIHKIFRKYIDTYSKGLNIVELPTSIGKTYSTFECVAQYTEDWAKYLETHKRNGKFRQILIVTPLKKNLQASRRTSDAFGKEELTGLREAYAVHGRLDSYDKEVMFLDSLTEILKNSISILDGEACAIPSYLQRVKCFEELKKKAYLLSTSSILLEDADLFATLSKEANKLYFEFRKIIVPAYQKQNNITFPITLTDIADTEGYSWLFQLYPDLLIPRMKVIMMSLDKLLQGRIYDKPSYAFMSDKFLTKKIIFIDEIDSTKMSIKDKLADDQSKLHVDFLQLFNDIYQGISNPWESPQFVKIEKNLNDKLYNKKKLVERARKRRDDYKLDHAYQAFGQLKEEPYTFIFKDDATRTITKTSSYLQVIAREADKHTIHLILSRINEMKEGDFFLESTVRWITGFLKSFAKYMHLLSTNYEPIENAKRINDSKPQISIEDACRSFLYTYGISRDENVANIQTKFLMDMADASKMSSRKQSHRGYDYYIDGFTYYSMEDADHHDENTIISMVDIPTTAESIMLKLSNHALVFGLSATAAIPSVTGNYNLEWLADSVEEYHDVVEETTELQQEVEEFLNRRYAPYYKGNIEVTVTCMDNSPVAQNERNLYGDGRTKACAILSEFTDRVAIKIENIIKNSLLFVKPDRRNYCAIRYYNLMKVLFDFASKKHMQSILVLSSKSVTENTDEDPNGGFEFDECVIRKIVSAVNYELHLNQEDQIDYECIYSKAFDSKMARIQQRLSDRDINGNYKIPERIAIISAYQSVATGQNMQYVAPQKYLQQLVRLAPRGSENAETYKKKDIDGIYLADITNLVSNFSQEKIDEKGLILDIFQAEELNSNWEITPEQKESNIKQAFNHLVGSYPVANTFRLCDSIRSERTRTVIQAVGRIGRSNQRCKEINIWIDSNVLDGLHVETLDRRFTSPETEALRSAHIGSKTCIMTNEQSIILNRAATISDRTAQYINSRRRAAEHEKEWEPSMMKWWEDMRETLKIHPTAQQDIYDKDPFIHENFIGNGGKDICQYYFSVNNRYYEHQRVWFGSMSSFAAADRNYKPYPKPHSDKELSIMEVSEENCRLSVIFKYPGLRQWWKSKGYAESIEPAPYIMSPFLYTEIYKGTIGETAGRFIFEHETGLHLNEISDTRKFEKADFIIAERPDEYVDFKHYATSTLKDGPEELKHILDKLDIIEGKRIYIINLIKGRSDDYNEKTMSFHHGRIIIIPWMISETGKVNSDIKKKITYKL